MEPTIRKGELLLLNRAIKEKIKVGDIIGVTYIRSNGTEIPLVHRVIKTTNGGIKTVADANRHFDQRNKIKIIEGKVTSIKIDGKWKHYEKKLSTVALTPIIVIFTRLSVRFPRIKILSLTRKGVLNINRLILKNS